MRYLLNKGYFDMVNNKLKRHLEGIDGIVDSIRSLVYSYLSENRYILNTMLKAF